MGMLDRRPDVYVTINMNLSQENKDEVLPLCHLLQEKGYSGTLFFSQVFKSANSQFEAVLDKRDDSYGQAMLIAEECGYFTEAFERISFMGCPINSPQTLIFGADGCLYSCINGVDDTKYRIGHVRQRNSSDFKKARQRWLSLDNHKSCCKNCRFVPYCGGNCYHRNDLHGFDCPKISYQRNEEMVLIKHLESGKER